MFGAEWFSVNLLLSASLRSPWCARLRPSGVFWLFILVILVADPVRAADAAAPALGPAGTGLPALGASVIRLFGGLAVVLALLLGGWYWLRRGPGFLRRSGAAPSLRVLEAKSLGGRQTLFVVGYERQRLLLGSTPGGIVFLAPLAEAPAPMNAEPERPVPVDFADAFRQALGQRS
jgi:flagellar biogenesis protein FliO